MNLPQRSEGVHIRKPEVTANAVVRSWCVKTKGDGGGVHGRHTMETEMVQ